MTWLPAYTLWRREIVRFVRQRNRVVSALLQPAMFWVFFGSGFENSFRIGSATTPGEAQGFLEFLFPGTIVLVLLFTAIFSTFSLIQDRNEGFLQSVLVAPVSRSGLVLGKTAGGTTLALLQGLLFLCLAPLAGVPLSAGTFLGAAGVLLVVGFGLTALGLACGWLTDSVQGFHALMMLLLMPLWLLSGAFFPLQGAPAWLGLVMRANPLTYGVAALRHALYPDGLAGQDLPSPGVSLGVSLAFAAVIFAVAWIIVGRRTRGDLR